MAADSMTADRHELTARQAHLLGVLRRSREDWLELWELSQRAGYTIKMTAANVRELRRSGLIVTRPTGTGLSTIEVSLSGPAP
jgi:hypothetical protein